MNGKPKRIIEGNAKPYEPFWCLRSAEDSVSGEPEIEFYGNISEYSWFEDDITPAKFKSDLESIGGGGPITVRIHSGGGDVFAASAIRAMLMDYPGKVTTRIDGLCASAATYVATAGDRVLMQDSAYFMIHDPWTVAIGGVDELKVAINQLKTIKDGIIEAYQSKSHLEAEEISKMMSVETWMTAQQALEKGFVDEVINENRKALPAEKISNMAILNCLVNYEHVPDELKGKLAEREDAEKEEQNVTVDEATSEASETVADETSEELTEETGKAIEAQLLRDYLDIFGPR